MLSNLINLLAGPIRFELQLHLKTYATATSDFWVEAVRDSSWLLYLRAFMSLRSACEHVDVGSHLNRISIRLCPHYTGLHTMFWKPHARLSVVLEPSTQGLISNSLYVILTWLPDYSRVSPCVSFFFYFKRLDWWSRKSICYGKYVLHLHCYVHENSHSFIHDMNSLVSCYRIIFEFYLRPKSWTGHVGLTYFHKFF